MQVSKWGNSLAVRLPAVAPSVCPFGCHLTSKRRKKKRSIVQKALILRPCVMPFAKLLYAAGPHLLRDDSTSQSPDPILKALYLHHNHIGIVSAVRHCSHTLKGAKEMHREFS